MVVFPTQLEVSHDNGHLRAGDNQDHKHKEQETKQVVELVLPNGLWKWMGEREQYYTQIM